MLVWVCLVVSAGTGTVQGVVGGTGGIPGTSTGAGSKSFEHLFKFLNKWLITIRSFLSLCYFMHHCRNIYGSCR